MRYIHFMYNTYPSPEQLLEQLHCYERPMTWSSGDATGHQQTNRQQNLNILRGFLRATKTWYQRRVDRSKMNVIPLRNAAKVRDIPHIGNSGKLTWGKWMFIVRMNTGKLIYTTEDWWLWIKCLPIFITIIFSMFLAIRNSFACISVLYFICLPFLTFQVIVSRLFFSPNSCCNILCQPSRLDIWRYF